MKKVPDSEVGIESTWKLNSYLYYLAYMALNHYTEINRYYDTDPTTDSILQDAGSARIIRSEQLGKLLSST